MTKRINPEILIIARESRGQSQEAVATAAGVSQGLISKAENGLIDLDDEHVERIADFLEYAPELFYEPGRARAVGSACLHHRKRKTLPAKILKSLNAQMELRLISTRRILRDLEIDADRMFHTMDPDEYGSSPVEVAKALRSAWRVPAGPIANMTALLESAGAVIVLSDFGTHKLMGMSCWERNAQPLFYLNNRMSTADLRWTLAHELGHLVMHSTPPGGDPEQEADEFAGEFLAPAALIVPELRKLTFDRLYALKAVWRISMKSLIVRAQKSGAIDGAQATRLFKQYSARGYHSGEPYPLPPEPPTLIGQAVDVHLRDHGYTLEELATGVAFLPEAEFIHELVPDRTQRGGKVVSLFSDSRQRA
jgi:Zn-dependent peptidase ImmA (M78 family)